MYVEQTAPHFTDTTTDAVWLGLVVKVAFQQTLDARDAEYL